MKGIMRGGRATGGDKEGGGGRLEAKPGVGQRERERGSYKCMLVMYELLLKAPLVA